jgi:tRNA pseudouridine55 synthase
MIVPLYKPYGTSTHLQAQKYGKLCQQKATHTGTLDPAAEGVVVVLTGGDRFKKEQCASTTKVYVAQILFGIATDSHDLIGLPTSAVTLNLEIDPKKLDTALQDLNGAYSQTLPAFSAKRTNGGSYFDLAKKGIPFKKDTYPITIEEITVLSSIKVPIEDVRTYQADRLKLIQGDFRQAEIKIAWSDLLSANQTDTQLQMPVLSLLIRCSKRTYVRAIVRDLSMKLGLPAVLYSLVRTENGPYSIKDCVCLV